MNVRDVLQGEAREELPHFTEDSSLRLIGFKRLANTFRNRTTLKGLPPRSFRPIPADGQNYLCCADRSASELAASGLAAAGLAASGLAASGLAASGLAAGLRVGLRHGAGGG